MSRKIDISFLIVNYNSQEYVKNCISSLLGKLNTLTFEIIVINNDSTPFNHAANYTRTINVGSNVGFGRANNIGTKEAKGRILCFLNPDSEYIEGDLINIVNEFKKNKEIGIIGPHILDNENNTQEWSFGEKINPFTIIKNNFTKPTTTNYLTKKEVDWVTGASFFIKKDFFQELGGFDENFFLYFEDIDICNRSWKAGKKVLHFPEIKIKHLGGKSNVNKSTQKKEYYKSQDYYIKKHYGLLSSQAIRFLRFFHSYN